MKKIESNVDLRSGDILTDLIGKQWRLGNVIGQGAFGEIYLASDNTLKEVSTDAKYVVKIESFTNGPLFVEINCYLRIAKTDLISKWRISSGLSKLGMPHYVASGSHRTKDNKYRFLIIPRYSNDLEQILYKHENRFNLKTALVISLQLLDVLEYIHTKGYIHSDIKASNIMLTKRTKVKPVDNSFVKNCVRYQPVSYPNIRSCRLKNIIATRNLRTNSTIRYTNSEVKVTKEDSSEEQVYLLDFGLATKYISSKGVHKSSSSDERKAHAGTLLFCSLDAHSGAQSRRSDLESLGYNIIYWLTGYLPWSDNTDLDTVVRLKQTGLKDLDRFLSATFTGQYPPFLYEYFNYLTNLEFTQKPNYKYLKKLFLDALKDYGYKNDGLFDFNNTAKLSSLVRNKKKRLSENTRPKLIKKRANQLMRSPLKSNLPVKPKTRKKSKLSKQLKWSKILMTDPEIVLKKARARKCTELSDSAIAVMSVADLDIYSMNPTAAMLDVYNKSIERCTSNNSTPKYKGDSNCPERIEGYTSAMMSVYQIMKEREFLEMQTEEIPTKISTYKSTRARKTSTKNSSVDLFSPRQTRQHKRQLSPYQMPVCGRITRSGDKSKLLRSPQKKYKASKTIISPRLKRAVRNLSRNLRSCRLKE